MENFLQWSRKMAAKPAKCLSLGMKVIKNKYTAFNPELQISGTPVPWIGQAPIKFLGGWIHVDLKDFEVRDLTKKKLNDMLETVDTSLVSGPSKAWLYNNLVIPKILWELTIYNYPVTFIRSLESDCTRYLKKWFGLAHPCNVSVLYRSKDSKSLNLKKIETAFKCCQVLKGFQLENSKDNYINDVYQHQKDKTGAHWSYAKGLEDCKRQAYFQKLVGHVCQGREGLGFKMHFKDSSESKSLTNTIREISEQQLLMTLYDKKVQGRVLTWEDAMTFDLSWRTLIYSLSPDLVMFYLNSIHDTCATPNNPKLWNCTTTGRCSICNRKNCNLKHILTCCPVALKQSRYNWRHDMVLHAIMSYMLYLT